MWTSWNMDYRHCSLFVCIPLLIKSSFLYSKNSQATDPQNSQTKTWTDELTEILRTFMRFDRQSRTPGNHSLPQKPSSNGLIRECETLAHDSENFTDTVKQLEQKINNSDAPSYRGESWH